jgi:hypothetical protein
MEIDREIKYVEINLFISTDFTYTRLSHIGIYLFVLIKKVRSPAIVPFLPIASRSPSLLVHHTRAFGHTYYRTPQSTVHTVEIISNMAHRQLATAAARAGRLSSVAGRIGQRSFSIVSSVHLNGRQTTFSQARSSNGTFVKSFSTAADEPSDKKEEIEFQA